MDSYTVTADDANQYLRATASYTDGQGSGKTASATLRAPVGDIRPAANTAPEFTETGPVTLTVREGTGAGRNVGSRVRATDADQGDVLTFSLSGTDDDAFDIDAATGQIRTKDVLEHDPDPLAQNTYTVTVSVHDGFDGGYNESSVSDATIEVTITVTSAPVVVRPRPTTPPPTTEEEDSITTTTPTGGGGGGGGGVFLVPVAPAPGPPSFTAGLRTVRPVAADAQPGDVVGRPVVAVHPTATSVSYSLSGDRRRPVHN